MPLAARAEGGRYKPDPASKFLTAGARRLLERAYASPGEWVSTRLADPGPRTRTALISMGINWKAGDDASASGGAGLDAKDRWGRAFARALWREHKWHSSLTPGTWRERRTTPRTAGALRLEFGRRLPAAGVIPAGRQVSAMYDTGGKAALRAVGRLPSRDRIYDDAGGPGARWSDPELRDW